MIIIINGDLKVQLEAASRFFIERKIFLQWKELVLIEGDWVVSPENFNSIVGVVAEGDAHDAFVTLSDAEKQEAYTTFIQNQYL